MSFRKFLQMNSSKTMKGLKLGEPYIKHVLKRPLKSNVTEEWKQAQHYPGEPQRVHGDGKSLFQGAWTLWVKVGALPGSNDKTQKKTVILCNPGRGPNDNFREEDVMFSVEVDEIGDEWKIREKCEETTKEALREAYEHLTKKPLA